MALCPNCKVEVGNSVRHCPLCRSAIQPGDANPAPHMAYPDRILDPDDHYKLTPREKRKVFLELYTACSLIAAGVVLAINILIDHRLSWSLYPLASFAFLWLLVGIPQLLAGRPWLAFAFLGPSGPLFLLALDAMDGSFEWFFSLGLPIALLIEAVALACWVLASGARRKGINVIAIILTGAVLVCVGLEMILNLSSAGRLYVSWSAIVMIAGLPLAVFLFYTHYRIVNKASLRKLFHL
jgi:predicted nucleic acid-binding Zn ribbon protein